MFGSAPIYDVDVGMHASRLTHSVYDDVSLHLSVTRKYLSGMQEYKNR